MSKLLTETADYDTPGSWGRASEGWPEFKPSDNAYNAYVFANCIETIPYGSYVLMSREGKYGACVNCLRVHPEHIAQLQADYEAAGKPTADFCVEYRKKHGKKNRFGNEENAKPWWK